MAMIVLTLNHFLVATKYNFGFNSLLYTIGTHAQLIHTAYK